MARRHPGTQQLGTKGQNSLWVRSHRISVGALLILLTAAWGSPADAWAQERESAMLGVLKFTTGVICAYALHETGHAMAANLTNTDMEWGIGTYNQPLGFTERADSDSDGMIVHAAGLAAQGITSEIILQSESIDKNDNFVRGMMAWNIINPILYVLDYWVIKSTNKAEGDYYQGDLQGFEHYSNQQSANLLAVTLAALTTYQGYRFVKTQSWAPDWIKSNTVRLDWQPRPDAGMQLMLHFSF